MNVCCVIRFLYPAAIEGTDYTVTDYGAGPQISSWSSRLGSQPTVATLAANEPAAILAEAKALQIEAIRASCQTTIEAGFVSNATGTARRYPAATRDQANLEAANLRATLLGALATMKLPLACAATSAELTAPVWPLVDHSPKQARDVHGDFTTWRDAQRQQLRGIVAKVQSATTTDGARSVNWTPATVTTA